MLLHMHTRFLSRSLTHTHARAHMNTRTRTCSGMPLPDRPGQLPCQFYMKTGKCKYGWQCKFDHPKSQLVRA